MATEDHSLAKAHRKGAVLPAQRSGTAQKLRYWWARRRRRPLLINRCPATSPEGERCKYRRGHDSTGEPHSWTRYGIGGFTR